MPGSGLIFLACWLLAALAGGVALVWVWEKLRAKDPGGVAPPDQPVSRS